MPVPSKSVPKPRKPRPSRARGLRTTTGCFTCRKRRVKCDELRPRCVTCAKSDRDCSYASNTDTPSNPTTNGLGSAHALTPPTQGEVTAKPSPVLATDSVAQNADTNLFASSPELLFDSPLTNVTSGPSPTSAPLEWFDLLHEDAINNIDKYNLNLDFDRACLSRRHSLAPDTENIDPQLRIPRPAAQAQEALSPPQEQDFLPPSQEQWNSSDKIHLSDDQLVLLQHYINVVGPILDVCDPSNQFTCTVPSLAVYNVGVLKSLLAVAARHLALSNEPQLHRLSLSAQTPGSTFSDSSTFTSPLLQVATRYYYETLHYLSQNLLYQSYSQSREIVATALLISTYEMFDAEGQHSNGAWERHLRGIFWIQKSQNNNGECNDPLRRAAWWQWIRQDTWVAFREGRRVLTIWRPTKRLVELSADELCLRIVYICGRCVDFAASERKYDLNTRIDQSGKLLQTLEDWYRVLPPTFKPLYNASQPFPGSLFSPIWIHPPSYAAAIQIFHFARIILLINQPSKGGMDDYRVRQRFLDESVETVCGIVIMHQGKHLPSAFTDFQALYAAGLCVQSPSKQAAILHLLEQTLDTTKCPPKTLLDDLASFWRAET